MRDLAGPLLVFAAALSWSTAGLFTRVVTTDIPTTLFWRSLFGGLCVLAIAMAMRRSADLAAAFRFTRGEAVIATLSTAGMICFISAFFHTSIANVSFAYGAMPLVTYLLSLAVLREASRLVPWLCCGAATLGVALITTGNSALSDHLGIALALAMTFFMAALTVAAKFFPDADMVKATYLSAFLGAVAVAPFATFSAVTGPDYAWLWLYGFVNVGLGFGVYLLGVSRVTALAAALIGLVEIPLAPVWAWLLFEETVNGLILVGGALILVGGALILAAAAIYLAGTGDRKEGTA